MQSKFTAQTGIMSIGWSAKKDHTIVFVNVRYYSSNNSKLQLILKIKNFTEISKKEKINNGLKKRKTNYLKESNFMAKTGRKSLNISVLEIINKSSHKHTHMARKLLNRLIKNRNNTNRKNLKTKRLQSLWSRNLKSVDDLVAGAMPRNCSSKMD